MLEREQRTVSNLANIIGELKERLHRWTKAGQYGFVFDNVEDTLSFSRFEAFNFNGWGEPIKKSAASCAHDSSRWRKAMSRLSC